MGRRDALARRFGISRALQTYIHFHDFKITYSSPWAQFGGDTGDAICHVPPLFSLLGFVFGEVSK